jgi:hypothetical protein
MKKAMKKTWVAGDVVYLDRDRALNQFERPKPKAPDGALKTGS